VGLAVNVAAVTWLAGETLNTRGRRSSLAPPGAPFYQVWATPLVLGAIVATGLAIVLLVRPHRRRAAPSPPVAHASTAAGSSTSEGAAGSM
jgi:hypothetical protein